MLTFEHKMMTSRGKNDLYDQIPNGPLKMIHQKVMNNYSSQLNKAQEMVSRVGLCFKTLDLQKMFLKEYEFMRFSSHEISELYAYGFIKIIAYKEKLPKGIPEEISRAILKHKNEGVTNYVLIQKNVPIISALHFHSDLSDITILNGYYMKEECFPPQKHEPIMLQELLNDKELYFLNNVKLIEKIGSTRIFLQDEDEDINIDDEWKIVPFLPL